MAETTADHTKKLSKTTTQLNSSEHTKKSRHNVMQRTTTTATHKHNVHLFTLLFEHSREQNLVQLWWKPMENARNDGSFQNDLAFDRVSEMAMKQIVSDRLRYIYNKNMFGRRS